MDYGKVNSQRAGVTKAVTIATIEGIRQSIHSIPVTMTAGLHKCIILYSWTGGGNGHSYDAIIQNIGYAQISSITNGATFNTSGNVTDIIIPSDGNYIINTYSNVTSDSSSYRTRITIIELL